jgi:hypothetical protein
VSLFLLRRLLTRHGRLFLLSVMFLVAVLVHVHNQPGHSVKYQVVGPSTTTAVRNPKTQPSGQAPTVSTVIDRPVVRSIPDTALEVPQVQVVARVPDPIDSAINQSDPLAVATGFGWLYALEQPGHDTGWLASWVGYLTPELAAFVHTNGGNATAAAQVRAGSRYQVLSVTAALDNDVASSDLRVVLTVHRSLVETGATTPETLTIRLLLRQLGSTWRIGAVS